MYKQYQAILQRSFTCNIQGEWSENDSDMILCLSTQCTVQAMCMHRIAIRLFHVVAFMDGAVCSVLTACIRSQLPFILFLMPTHFPSSLIFIPLSYRYSTGALYCFIHKHFFHICSMNSQDTCYNYRCSQPAPAGGWSETPKWNGKKGGKMP